MTAAGVPRDQPRSIRRHAIAADRPSPISTTTVTPFGWSCAIADANASLLVAGHDQERGRDAAVRDRNARRRRRGDRARDARHDVVGDAGVLQRQRFFAAAAEDERVAALQPHDAPAARGRRESSASRIAACVMAWRPARLPTKKRCARRA